MRRYILPLLISIAVLLCTTSCRQARSERAMKAAVESILDTMSVRSKVGQMMFVRPEVFLPESCQGKAATEFSDTMAAAFSLRPAGGMVLFAANCPDPAQLKAFTTAIHALPGRPLVCVDEEGGSVARLARNKAFCLKNVSSMTDIARYGRDSVFNAASYIGTYLKEYGFDIDLAPVADVNSNPLSPVIGVRSFSENPDTAAIMVQAYLEGLGEAGIVGCLKHFPGHGEAKTDSHHGYAESLKTWDEMLSCEMIPFKAGIQAGAQMIMTAHITAPNVDSTLVPSTLSRIILEDKLRGELGYQGIITTDGMGMAAISKHYSPGEAAVRCVQAGADIVLLPADYAEAFEALLGAVRDGTISEERINQSVRRILTLKYKVSQR